MTTLGLPVTVPCITAVVSTLMKPGSGVCVTSRQFFWRGERYWSPFLVNEILSFGTYTYHILKREFLWYLLWERKTLLKFWLKAPTLFSTYAGANWEPLRH